MHLKKVEIAIILFCVLVGIISVIALQTTGVSGDVVVIQVKGEEQTYSLEENQIISVQGKEGTYNQIKIEDGKVSMQEADCENQICVHHHAIRNTRESIVCIPNEVVVTIQKEEKEEEVDAVAE